jgi:hypothetical protein
MANLSAYAFIELFVVLAFLGAWGILELVCKRLDARTDRGKEAVGAEHAADVSAEKPAEIGSRRASIDGKHEIGKSEDQV